MRQYLALIALMGSPLPAQAETCSGLGLSSDYLTSHFCKQLKAIEKDGEATRGISGSSDTDTTGSALPDWPDITILQDAYRADLRKTLELIRRIKDAGGLTTN